jgi:hypothetical protein
MSTFRFQLAVSLDGFVAGPDQSEEIRSALVAWISISGSSSSRPGASGKD